jgi:hypothetical protein
LEPVFTDPAPIRTGCPAALREVLERWLALHALHALQMYAEFADAERVEFLLAAFPEVRRHRRELASAQLKLRFPRLHRLVRAAVGR